MTLKDRLRRWRMAVEERRSPQQKTSGQDWLDRGVPDPFGGDSAPTKRENPWDEILADSMDDMADELDDLAAKAEDEEVRETLPQLANDVREVGDVFRSD